MQDLCRGAGHAPRTAMLDSNAQLKGLLLIASVVVIWVLASFLVQNVEQSGMRSHDSMSDLRHPTPPSPPLLPCQPTHAARSDLMMRCRWSATSGIDLRRELAVRGVLSYPATRLDGSTLQSEQTEVGSVIEPALTRPSPRSPLSRSSGSSGLSTDASRRERAAQFTVRTPRMTAAGPGRSRTSSRMPSGGCRRRTAPTRRPASCSLRLRTSPRRQSHSRSRRRSAGGSACRQPPWCVRSFDAIAVFLLSALARSASALGNASAA